jgi:hypothetical protein
MSGLIEPRRYRVTVEVPFPAEDWLTQLLDGPQRGCATCREPLPSPAIYLNTEGEGAGDEYADNFCSWSCVVEMAAGVVAVEGESTRPLVEIVEIPDWRINQ